MTRPGARPAPQARALVTRNPLEVLFRVILKIPQLIMNYFLIQVVMLQFKTTVKVIKLGNISVALTPVYSKTRHVTANLEVLIVPVFLLLPVQVAPTLVAALVPAILPVLVPILVLRATLYYLLFQQTINLKLRNHRT